MDDILKRIQEERQYQKNFYNVVHDSKHTYLDWISIIIGKLSSSLQYDEQYFEDTMVVTAALCVAALEAKDGKNTSNNQTRRPGTGIDWSDNFTI